MAILKKLNPVPRLQKAMPGARHEFRQLLQMASQIRWYGWPMMTRMK